MVSSAGHRNRHRAKHTIHTHFATVHSSALSSPVCVPHHNGGTTTEADKNRPQLTTIYNDPPHYFLRLTTPNHLIFPGRPSVTHCSATTRDEEIPRTPVAPTGPARQPPAAAPSTRCPHTRARHAAGSQLSLRDVNLKQVVHAKLRCDLPARANYTSDVLAGTDVAREKLRAPSPNPSAGPSSGALSAPAAARSLQAPGGG